MLIGTKEFITAVRQRVCLPLAAVLEIQLCFGRSVPIPLTPLTDKSQHIARLVLLFIGCFVLVIFLSFDNGEVGGAEAMTGAEGL
jgi:hypothetical protein